MQARFERPVSANEHLYLAVSRTFSHLVLQLVVEGRGRISTDALQSALNKTADHVPGSCLRLQQNRWIADAAPPRVVHLEEYPDLRSREDVSSFPRSYFDPEEGRTCEAALAHRGEDSLIVFRALHAVMDGHGVQQWAKAVFCAMRGDDIPDAKSPLTDDAFLRQTKAPIRWDEPFVSRNNGPIARLSSPADAEAFDSASRTLQPSIPGIIGRLAVGTRKLLCSSDKDRFCAMIPVDLRRTEQDARDSTANLTFPLFLSVGADESWPDVTRNVLDQLDQKRYARVGPKDWLYPVAPPSLISWVFRKAWLRQLRQGRYFLSAVISHVGKVESQDFRTGGFEQRAVYCPPFALPVAPLSFVVTEHAQGTEVFMVKARSLWKKPGDVLDNVIELAGLKQSVWAPISKTGACIFGLPLRQESHVPDISIRIDEAARKYLDRSAVTDGLSKLSYGEFIAKRNRIAGALLYLAGKPLAGERIALAMRRSVDAFLCIHACVELNAVFVPIDPVNPEERVRMMVDDCEPALLIHDQPLAGCGSVRAISIEALAALEAPEDKLESRPRDPSDLAYIIYTSGTTGKSKGVCVSRGNLSHYTHHIEKDFLAGRPHRSVALIVSLSFDPSIVALFAPLLQGCEVKMMREEVTVLALEQALDDPDITFCAWTPAHLRIVAGLGRRPASKWLGMTVGGESISPELCQEAIRLFGPQLELIGAYGPTETTVSVIHHRFDPQLDAARIVPIGKAPIDCASLYILRDDVTPCAIGEEGEIYIGGYVVARGYWRNEALTRERFVPDPFLGAGALMYRTGDRAVCRNGDIFFAGRHDDQVKLNGYRIELEEICSLLRRYPAISNAAIVVDDSGVKPVLRAFFEAPPSARVNVHDLTAYLNRFLPRFMIPSSLVEVASIPLNANGKVDRRLLLTVGPVYDRPEHMETEHTSVDVGDIWSKYLKTPRDQLTLESDFFALGGDSILLLEILNEINRVLCNGQRSAELRMGLREFFLNPSLIQMMRWVDRWGGSSPGYPASVAM
jgi:amino acid adenylation domain-containing protein